MKMTRLKLFVVLLGAVLFGESTPQQVSGQPEISTGKLGNAIRLLNTHEVSYKQDSALFPAGYTQQPTTPPQAMGHADPIIGAWKLDVDKSTNPTAEAEILTITPQGDQFQQTVNLTTTSVASQ